MADQNKKKDIRAENAPIPDKLPGKAGKKDKEEEEPTADELRQMMKKNNSEARGPGAGRMIREKPKNLRQTVGKLLKYIGRSKWLVFLIMLTTVLTSVLNSLGPRLQGNAMNAMTLSGGRVDVDFEALVKTLVLMGIVYLASALMQLFQGFASAKISQTTVYTLRQDLFRKISYLPISYLPFGFSGAGTLTKAQANDTGLAGTDYYTNPEDPSCIFTYQRCGTPTGLNEVDSGHLTWQYVRWVPVDTVHGSTRPLTLDDVRRLAEKGEALTWDDLAMFDSYDASEQWDPTESEGDPYIRVCPIEAMFELRIGGESPKTPPRYVYLRNRDINACCEIRTRDVGAFLDIYQHQQKNGHADMNRLVEKYPEYFDLPTDRGLAVYVWQMSAYSYSCALLPDSGKTREPTELWNLKGANLAEMRLILSTYDISPEKVAVIPWINPLSSYSYSVDEDYIETLRMRLIAHPYPNLLEDYSAKDAVLHPEEAQQIGMTERFEAEKLSGDLLKLKTDAGSVLLYLRSGGIGR